MSKSLPGLRLCAAAAVAGLYAAAAASAAIYAGSGYGVPLAADGLSNLALGRDAGVQASYRFRNDHDGTRACSVRQPGGIR